MSQNNQDSLETARIDAVKSATEIINGISRTLTFKDLDLLLINTFILPRQDNIYQVCDDWANRDYRQVGMIYGGSLTILSLLLMAMNAFAFLPIVLFSIVFSRYVMLRRALTHLSRRRSMHQFTMDIARYVILRNKIDGKKTTFRDISTKYTTLKYARERSSINGCDFIRLFVSLDMEIDFYNMLHGVIDDVLEYVIEGESSDSALSHKPEYNSQQDETDKHWEHDSAPQEFLDTPPEESNSRMAREAENRFASALSGDDDTSPDLHENSEILSASTNHDDESDNESRQDEVSSEEHSGKHNSIDPLENATSDDAKQEENPDDPENEDDGVREEPPESSSRTSIEDGDDGLDKSEPSSDESNEDEGDTSEAEDEPPEEEESESGFDLEDFDDDLDKMTISAPEVEDDQGEDEDDDSIDKDLLKDFGLSDDDFK